MAICEKCGKTHDGTFGSGRFCSRSCANSRVRTTEIKQKIRRSVYKFLESKNIKRKTIAPRSSRLIIPEKRICVICGKEFDCWYAYSTVQCCSQECRNLLISRKNKQAKLGGYKEHSGRGKSGWYQGIHCQSTYELAWVIYALDHQVKFKRCDKCFLYTCNNASHKYYPDFELADGTIVEIKGYHQEIVNLKQQAVLDSGYNYLLLYKKDLQPCYDYIKQKYNISEENLVTLYDKSNGYATFTCAVCGKKFKRKLSKNSNVTCCSRQCIGKLVAQKYHKKKNYSPIV